MFLPVAKFVNYIKFLLFKIFELPNILRAMYSEFQAHIKFIRYNMSNLREANIALAHHHMKLGNLNDVILRCFIITKFIDNQDAEAYNLLAFVYYLKGNIEKSAKNLFLAGQSADLLLKKFIETKRSEIDEIPIEIFSKYRNYNIDHYIEDKADLYTSLSKMLVDELFENIDEISEDFNILDINSSVGAIADALVDRIGKGFNITAVECAEEIRAYLSTEMSVYDKILDYQEFMKASSGKYDAIFSVLGVEYRKHFSEIIKNITNLMKKNSLFGLVLRASESGKTYLNKAKNAFIYGEDFVVQQLDIADFQIIAIKEIVISADRYLVIVSAKKKW